jgi:tetratricopeptide (TPR) repeat protein
MALFGEAREDLHSSMKSRRKAEKALKMLRAVAAEADENRLADSAPMRKIRGLAWFAAAGVAYVLDQEDDAIGYCDKSIAAGAPGPAVLNLKGSAQLVLGDHERARLTFGEVLASKADDDARFEALSGAGRAHHHLGEHDLAVDLFRSALAMPCDDARTDPVVMQRLAESYDELGRHTAALHAYRRAWRRFGKRERPARLVTGISAMLLRLNQPEEARAFIEQERKHAVADRAIDFNLALSLARLGDTKRAVEVAEQIKTWKPAAELLDALGRSAGRDWSGHWFGEPGSARSWAGALLLAMVAIGFFAPPVLQLWREGTVDLEHALPLGAIALVLFVLPVAKSLNVEVPGLKLGVEPASRGREEDGKALDRIAPASLTAALRAPALPPRSDVATRAGEPDEVAREAEDFANRGLKVRVAIDEPSDDDADETGAPRKYRRRPRAGRAPSKS